jgi:tRNA (cmo5U34)-methyltransferase
MIQNASVVILNLTLQFVRPLQREKIIQQIANGLNPDGCLIFVEKVLTNNSTINQLYVKFHHDFKRRNGYSDLEIAQKRDALENVLIPYRFEENRALLLNNGFRACENFFCWYNFCGFLAIK